MNVNSRDRINEVTIILIERNQIRQNENLLSNQFWDSMASVNIKELCDVLTVTLD